MKNCGVESIQAKDIIIRKKMIYRYINVFSKCNDGFFAGDIENLIKVNIDSDIEAKDGLIC